MKIDLYSKIVLTLIVLTLVAILMNLHFFNIPVVNAQTSPQVVPLGATDYVIAFMDPNTGHVWTYRIDGNPKKPIAPVDYGRLVELGKPLQR